MKIILEGKEEIAKDTLLLSFKPETKVNYIAGDFIYLTIPLIYPDSRGDTRQFSLSSSPTENLLQTAMRLTSNSGYKKSIQKIQIGDFFEIDQPIGTLHLNDTDTTPQVFIAGGVGIVPFRSRIKYIQDKKLPIPIQLIYSNHTRQDVCFFDELDTWEKENTLLKVNHVFSKIEGRLTTEKFKILLTKPYDAKYWITGSPAFVDSIEEMLLELGITNNQIVTEKFTGY
ncbi:MAG: FAD-dependent oxidoreductase [Patescibacteria group bacterium]